MNLIGSYYFFSFLLTQTFFFLGFLTIKPINIKNVIRNSSNARIRFSATAKILFYISVLLYVPSQLFVYYHAGIPLFMESRLETFIGGSGFGIFSRIILATSTIVSTILIYKIFFVKGRFFFERQLDTFLILFIIATGFLSGSKMTFLGLVFIMFFVVFFNYRAANSATRRLLRKIRKRQWQLFFIAVIAAIAVVTIQFTLKYGGENTINPLTALMRRFISSGDTYVLAYPNNYLSQMKGGNPFLALFGDIFGMTRIVPWEDLPKGLGLQLYQSHYNTNLISGPNAKHNVFGLHYFGPYLSVLFSFLLGMLVSFFRNKLFYKVGLSVTGMVVYIIFAINALSLETDPHYAIGQYISIFVIFIPLYIVSALLASSITKKKTHEKRV
jgi:heme/copper-type cytochrome/quinol oxidase subunit 2